MLSEAPSTGTAALSPRAGIALLTLQLRASLQEATAAEAADAGADHDAARDELRGRLEPLMEQRRQGLEASLARARAEAATAVGAARRAASVMVAEASSRLEEVPATSVAIMTSVEIVAPAEIVAPVKEVAPVVLPALPVAEVAAPLALLPAPQLPAVAEIAWAQPVPSQPVPSLPAPSLQVPSQPVPSQPAPTTVVIDATAFATVFATVFAALLDERLSAWGAERPAQPVYVPSPVQPSPKRSFWSHARHPDVLLMGLATVIVLVVLAAWLA